MTNSDLELEEGGQKVIEADGESVLLCKSGGALYALHPICPHQGAKLEGGRLRGRTISCPLHGARFDMTNGKSLGGANYPPLVVYDIACVDGKMTLSKKQA